jgi:type I restriction enzyme S subunit
MSDDDIPAEHADETSMSDATETTTDGGTVETEPPQSRFWGVVPPEWELVKGSEVYDVNPSYTPEEEEVTYIEMDALDTELPFPKYTKKRKAADYSGKLFHEGDTLFARITPCTENGKTAFVGEMETDVGIGSTEYAVLSPDRERIHPLYLYYVTKSHPVRNYAISRMRGSTGRQRVPFDVFRRELDIALPPEEEQLKITSVLQTVDLAIENIDKSIRIADRAQRAAINDVFGKSNKEAKSESEEHHVVRLGPKEYVVPKHWERTNIGSLGEVVTGDTPSTNNGSNYGGDLPFITPKDFGDSKYVSSGSRTLTDAGREEARPIPEGSVMMDCIGMDMGKTRITETEVATNQQINSVVPNRELVTPEFLYYHLRAISDLIKSQAGQTRTPIVNKSQFSEYEVLLPPVEEQQEIVEKLDVFDDIISSDEKARRKLKRIKIGLLQDLLTGKVRTKGKNIEIIEKVMDYA